MMAMIKRGEQGRVKEAEEAYREATRLNSLL
jgi:hypothetical protein